MDRLSILLENFEIRTTVFGHGTLCGESSFDIQPGQGHIHVIKKAPLEVRLQDRPALLISEPSLIFFPKPKAHSFKSTTSEGADMICATVSIGGGIQNPLTIGIPEPLVIPLSELKDFEKIFDLLYSEAFDNRCGKQQAINLLMDYLIVRMYRFAIQEDLIASSAIAGLADPKIAKSVVAMHQQPGHHWTLDSMASEAGMSRARFSKYFKDKVGMTPLEYLTELRVNIAIRWLIQGKTMKSIHTQLGYASASSFGRAFLQKMGVSPKEWHKNHSLAAV